MAIDLTLCNVNPSPQCMTINLELTFVLIMFVFMLPCIISVLRDVRQFREQRRNRETE